MIAAVLQPADPRPHVDPLTGAVARDPATAALPAADAAALEHALRIGEAWGMPVLAIGIGPPEPLREALALGCAALAIDARDEPVADLRPLARAVAAAARAAAVVLCGDGGPLPAFVAHELGAAQALGLVRLEPGAGHLLAERRLCGGRRERLRVPTPAVCSVEAAGVRLRRAPLQAALAAQAAAIPALAAPPQRPLTLAPPRPHRPRPRVVAPPPGESARERLLALTGALRTHEPPALVGPVGAVEAADALLAFLERHGYGVAP